MTESLEFTAPTYHRPSPAVVRAWAIERGLAVGKRGAIPGDVYLAYAEWELARR